MLPISALFLFSSASTTGTGSPDTYRYDRIFAIHEDSHGHSSTVFDRRGSQPVSSSFICLERQHQKRSTFETPIGR